MGCAYGEGGHCVMVGVAPASVDVRGVGNFCTPGGGWYLNALSTDHCTHGEVWARRFGIFNASTIRVKAMVGATNTIIQYSVNGGDFQMGHDCTVTPPLVPCCIIGRSDCCPITIEM